MKGLQIVPAPIAEGVSDSLRFGTTTFHRLKHPIISDKLGQQQRCVLAVPTEVRHSADGPYCCGALLLRTCSIRSNHRATIGGCLDPVRRSRSIEHARAAHPSGWCPASTGPTPRSIFTRAGCLVSATADCGRHDSPSCINCRSSPRLLVVRSADQQGPYHCQ